MSNKPQYGVNMSLSQLLKANRTYDKNYFSHVSIEPSGTYAIGREYHNDLYSLISKEKHGILENPGHYIPVYFDIDIKKDCKDYKEHIHKNGKFYTYEEVKEIISIVNQVIKGMVECSDDELYCCLLEKDIYKKKESMSGGFHLHWAGIFMNRYDIRNILIPNVAGLIKQKVGYDIDDVYTKNWFMYNGSKSLDSQPYILTKSFDISLKEMTMYETFKNYKIFDTNENPIEITEENVNDLLPRIFSIHPYNRDVKETTKNEYKEKVKVKEKRKKKTNDDRNVEEKLIECRKLLPLLSQNRVDEYDDWMKLGWCLFNIAQGCNEGLDLWDEKSQESSKYDAGSCEEKWEKMNVKEDGLNIGSLKQWAKEDSPVEYELLYKKNNFPEFVFIDDDIIECGEKIVNECTHNNLAKIYADYSKDESFYTTGYGWIIYDKESKTWSYDNDKVSLIFPISSFFCDIMKEYYNYYIKSQNLKEMSSKEEEEFHKTIKNYSKIKKDVGNSGFIKGVIEQIQSLLTKDNSFLDNFDNKPNLFAFSDGKCIDLLKNGQVREIVKEDFIITTCGYPYPKRDQTYITICNNIIKSLSNDPEQIKSIKSQMSLPLWGENTNEVFVRLTGSGGNGKGLLDTIMKIVYGPYYKSINASQLTEYEKDNQRANSELASCRFARLVMATEPPDSNSNGKAATLKVPTLKKWTGRDTITTRFLHKQSFDFIAKFILMLQENNLTDLSVNDEAIQRRMKIVELPFKFVVNDGRTLGKNEFFRDETLKDTIKQDKYRDAFFYILLDTWVENTGRFYESQKVKEITSEFLETQNPVKPWFEEFYDNDDNNKITATEMFNSYKNYNYDTVLTSTSFGTLLKQCCKSKKSKSASVYLCKKKPVQKEEVSVFNGVPL